MGALEDILQRQSVWRGRSLAKPVSALSSGFTALDAELPGGGWPRQALTEVLSDVSGIGELGLVLPALAALTAAGQRAVWIAPPHVPYAPALAAAGVDLVNLLIVGPQNRYYALWAAEQALRSGSCHAVAAWLPKARYAELQRLAVAAEAGRAAAFVLRPLAAAAESSPACLRLVLEPAGLELGVHIVKRRGAPLATPLYLPLKRPFHVLGRAAPPRARGGDSRAARRLGLPVHA
ncbi:MAG TPA: translesion DNA synthesis-associated protein ImuA [Burkholderiales bacterium]|nr:translesion DNA synthesis-associated protein ImuA [Burkholderiales bacterium]